MNSYLNHKSLSQMFLSQLWIIGRLYLSMLFVVVNSSPPANPVSCSFGGRNCTVLNSYGAFSDHLWWYTQPPKMIYYVSYLKEHRRDRRFAWLQGFHIV